MDALLSRDPHAPVWGYTEELLAQVVEEVSVIASQRARPEPRTVHRPGMDAARTRATVQPLVVDEATGRVVATGSQGMLELVRRGMGKAGPS